MYQFINVAMGLSYFVLLDAIILYMINEISLIFCFKFSLNGYELAFSQRINQYFVSSISLAAESDECLQIRNELLLQYFQNLAQALESL